MLFGLRKAFDMLFEEGLENVFERHRLLAEAVRRAAAAWAESGALEFNITEPAERSNSVTTLLFNDGRDPMPLRDYCERKCGVVVGVGIGEVSGKALRIAHMGHVNAPMVLGTLGGFEIGLIALDIPHGPGGLRAATEWLGRSVAV
jgi:alanine-glyoxylate transaminase/serine-glyoxylate transaminase/serine-pyruvate transaminase